MAEIKPPNKYFDEVSTLKGYVSAISRWIGSADIQQGTLLGNTWFRGSGQIYDIPLVPGVYREKFTKRAEALRKNNGWKDLERARQHLERLILREFRTVGATFFDPNEVVDVYLTAQHFGVPTRLLDWTMNPLAALFFAVNNEKKHNVDDEVPDGEVFAVEPKAILPEPKPDPKKEGDEVLWGAETIRHAYVSDAIGESFWVKPGKVRPPLIVPLIPDNMPGRIGQQSSAFTLHMHNADSVTVPAGKLAKLKILAAGEAKRKMLNELLRMKINEFTIYNDLDHLSKDLKRMWDL